MEKGLTAFGGTGRYNWLAHIDAVGSHCGMGLEVDRWLERSNALGIILLFIMRE